MSQDTRNPPDATNVPDDGKLALVGLGPGDHARMTVRAQESLLAADHLVGPPETLSRLPALVREATDRRPTESLGDDTAGVRAVERARLGDTVAVVDRGCPTEHPVADAALDAAERAGVTVEVVPGVPQERADAALLGAPLGCDAVSLSLARDDWERRLRTVASRDFALALRNPPSTARFHQCCHVVAEHRPADTPAGVVHAGEATVSNLADVAGAVRRLEGDVTLLVGTDDTRVRGDRLVTRVR